MNQELIENTLKALREIPVHLRTGFQCRMIAALVTELKMLNLELEDSLMISSCHEPLKTYAGKK